MANQSLQALIEKRDIGSIKTLIQEEKQRNPEAATELVNKPINIGSNIFASPLARALALTDPEICETLLNERANPNQLDTAGNPPWYYLMLIARYQTGQEAKASQNCLQLLLKSEDFDPTIKCKDQGKKLSLEDFIKQEIKNNKKPGSNQSCVTALNERLTLVQKSKQEKAPAAKDSTLLEGGRSFLISHAKAAEEKIQGVKEKLMSLKNKF